MIRSFFLCVCVWLLSGILLCRAAPSVAQELDLEAFDAYVDKALEEWDEGDKWYARVQIYYELMENAGNRIVWQKTIEKKNIVPHKSPAEVIKGINIAMQQCVAEVEYELNAFYNGL